MSMRTVKLSLLTVITKWQLAQVVSKWVKCNMNNIDIATTESCVH